MRKINLGIIGGGINSTIGSTHIKALRATGKFNLISGIFSKNNKDNKKSIKKYSLKNFKTYTNINKFIQNEKKNLDFVLVITPPLNRLGIYEKLFANNLNVIAEKPILNDYKTCKKLQKIYKKKKLLFFTTYNYLYYPAIIEIRNIIKKIGKVIHFNIEINQDGLTLNKIRNVRSWRLKDYKIPNLFLDLSSHAYSLIFFLFGNFPNKIKSWSNKNNLTKIIDSNFSWVKCKNIYGKVSVNKNSLGKKNDFNIEIFCEKGSIEWKHKNPEIIKLSDMSNTIKIIDRDNYKIKYKNDLFTYKTGHPNGFLESFINLYNSIHDQYLNKNSKKKFALNFNDNLMIMKTLDSMKISELFENKWVKN